MDITSIPHDSYYKFLFIGGLVLLVASLFFIEDRDKAYEQYHYLNDSLKIELREDSAEMSFYEKTIPKLKSVNDPKLSEEERNSIRKYTDEILQDLEKRRSNTTKNEQRLNQVDHKIYHFHNSRWKYWLMIVVGSLFLLIGNKKWYEEQQIKDKILQRQLDLLNIEYEKKKTSNN